MEKVNFILYYELDESEDACVLRAADYGGDAERAWVLLEAVGESARRGRAACREGVSAPAGPYVWAVS